MAGEKDRIDAYLQTVARLEPEIAHTDESAWGTSIAVSLKRIADHMCGAEQRRVYATATGPLSREQPAMPDSLLFDAVDAALRYAMGHNLIEKREVLKLMGELSRRGVELHLRRPLRPDSVTWIDDDARAVIQQAITVSLKHYSMFNHSPPPNVALDVYIALAAAGFEIKRKDGT